LELAVPGKLEAKEYDAMVGDLTNYLAYMSEPAKQSRIYMGVWVLLFLAGLLVLVKKLKAEYWKDIK
jgi:ubiquinol-cytochrome c reductase cytochrome c1 subunit